MTKKIKIWLLTITSFVSVSAGADTVIATPTGTAPGCSWVVTYQTTLQRLSVLLCDTDVVLSKTEYSYSSWPGAGYAVCYVSNPAPGYTLTGYYCSLFELTQDD